MDVPLNPQEIDDLEKELSHFITQWQETQDKRVHQWRITLLLGFVGVLLISAFIPQLWWLGIILIAYTAGSLFLLLDEDAKTTQRILQNKKQLRLARLLLKYDASLGSVSKQSIDGL